MITKDEYKKAKQTIQEYKKQMNPPITDKKINYCSCDDKCLGIYHKDAKCKKLRGILDYS